MFVHPAQVHRVIAPFPAVVKARLVIKNPELREEMRLVCEVADGAASPELAEALRAAIREQTKLRGEVEFVAPGVLPNDGKVIDDQRRYD